MNREGGFTKGRDRSFHFGTMEYNIIGMISHLASMLPVANGLGYGFQLNNEKRIAIAFIGDGATSQGDFHEALNHASVWNLPVLFVIENNGYVKSQLPPGSRSFILGPLVDGYTLLNFLDEHIGYDVTEPSGIHFSYGEWRDKVEGLIGNYQVYTAVS